MAGYSASIVGVLALCLLSLLLALYSGRSKGAAGALSGPVLDARDDNRLYRIDRVHMNSVEALTPFVASAIIAMLVGMAPAFLAILVWLHLAIRLIRRGVRNDLAGRDASKADDAARKLAEAVSERLKAYPTFGPARPIGGHSAGSGSRGADRS